jgi:hypothetical protein
MKPYIPSKRLARGVLVLLGIQAFLALASMLSSLLQVQLLSRALAGEEISETEASLNDVRELGIGILTILAAIVSGVVFLRYLGRANHNARALGADDLSATPGWTIGSYFVPIVNLWWPYQILQEIWKASAAESGPWKSRPGSSLIGWWWGVRLIDSFVNQAVFRLSMAESAPIPNLERLIATTWLDFAAAGLDILLLVLSFWLIQRLQQRQVARRQTIGEPLAAQCPSCGESLGDLVFATNCPVCGTLVQPVGR